jgi:mannose-6-phosphate isomerase
MSVRLIEPRFVERVWGTTRLSPLFPDQDRKIGEVWFDAGSSFPLLVKFIFTSEKLSVQVHPEDEYARQVENSRGKTEMWHILSAEPHSTIALGFRQPVSEQQLRAAIADETVESLLNSVPVKPGDTFFAEAGTVHAIGAGIALCEIQQNSDVTYRLYDYGRGRDLHLEKGLAVATMGPYEGRREFPVACDHFTTELLDVTEPNDCVAGCDGVLIVLEGSGTIGTVSVTSGQVCLITADSGAVRVDPNRRMRLLHATCGSPS